MLEIWGVLAFDAIVVVPDSTLCPQNDAGTVPAASGRLGVPRLGWGGRGGGDGRGGPGTDIRRAGEGGATRRCGLRVNPHARVAAEAKGRGTGTGPRWLVGNARRARRGKRGEQTHAPPGRHLFKEVGASRIVLGIAHRDASHTLAVRGSCGRGSHGGSDGASLVALGRPFVALHIDAFGTPHHEVKPRTAVGRGVLNGDR